MFIPPSGSPATVRDLGNSRSAGHVKATIIANAGKRLTLRCPAPLTSGTPVRVDAGEALFLGEVAENDPNTGQSIVLVDQVIPSLPELARLMQSLCGEPARSQTAAAVR